jgi:hypothetical protein
VKFAITPHSRSGAPENALDLLWERLEGKRFEDVSFSRKGTEIMAHAGHDAPVSMERDEREEIGRLAVLDCVTRVCERVPELKIAWFAISPLR